MYTPNPNLITVCMLPANPADLTLEQARAMCGGDVKAVLRDMVRECLALDMSAPGADAGRRPLEGVAS